MFRSRAKNNLRDAERMAEDAWDQLAAALGTAGNAARRAKRQTVDLAGTAAGTAKDRVGTAKKEAKRRTNAAVDAIAGRKPARPWGWFAVFAALGATAGWLGGILSRRAAEHAETTAVTANNGYKLNADEELNV